MKRELSFRQGACPDDIEIVREIVTSSGFFYDREVDVAVELVCERLEKGEASGYYFLFAEYNKKVAGYTCFGSIACTKGCYDLYWIAVHNDFRGQGIGRILLQKTEDIIRRMSGRKIYIETSSREKYLPTQKFYESCRCILEARLPDFYDEGDDKLVYVRRL